MAGTCGSVGHWFRDGLHFQCTGCGDCCRGEGYVWVTQSEILELAAHLELDREVFILRHVRRVDGRLALIDREDEAEEKVCVFWEDGCTVYPARPRQCRSWPFWPENLATSQKWKGVAKTCPGVGQGKLYPVSEITRIARHEEATASGPASSRA